MGKPQSKQEEVIIAQTGGTNTASASQDHPSYTTNQLLGVLIGFIALLSLLAFYKYYKKAHKKWIRREITMNDLRRSCLRPVVSSLPHLGDPAAMTAKG